MRGRFVEQVERRLAGERPGQADPLLLPAGQLGRAPLGEVADVQPVEQVQRLGPGLAASTPRRRSGYATVSSTDRCGHSA